MTGLAYAERIEVGAAVREVVPLSAHADLCLPPDRVPALELLRAQDDGRVAELVPIRYGRMAANPFAYFRGSAAVMAQDLAGTPSTGVKVQLCGDAHIANFGVFESPERRLMFDVNDFDETLPGPFEWDVKRLAASCVLAGKAAGLSRKRSRTLTRVALGSYRTIILRTARMAPLDIWYLRFDYDEVLANARVDKRGRKLIDRMRSKAAIRTNLGALSKLTEVVDGRPRIRPRPPLVERVGDDARDDTIERVQAAFDEYRDTLTPSQRMLVDRYTPSDIASKVVGVGSVGTRCLIVLLLSPDGHPLFLQLKEAGPSVLEAHLGPSELPLCGQRVVVGQQKIQAVSDVLLGWARYRPPEGRDLDFYFRQLWDGKYSPRLDTMDEREFTGYVRACGAVLARAHARSGDAATIAGYLGDDDSFTDAVVEYAVDYAKLTESDHQALVDAVRAGEVEARSGI